jgi:hypothetical protein
VEFSVLSVNDNTTVATTLETLAKDQCKAESDALPLKINNVPQANLEQQIQLLAAQDALPHVFAIGNNQLLSQLHDAGQAIELDTGLDDPSNITPAARWGPAWMSPTCRTNSRGVSPGRSSASPQSMPCTRSPTPTSATSL